MQVKRFFAADMRIPCNALAILRASASIFFSILVKRSSILNCRLSWSMAITMYNRQILLIYGTAPLSNLS